MRLKFIVLAAIVAAFGAVVAEVSSAGQSAPRELVVALDGTFTSPVVTSGTFVTGGAVADTGTHTDVTTFSPKTGRPNLITITVTCHGKKGSFTFVGKVHTSQAGFLAPGVSISSVPSADRITRGTGAYASLVGAVTGKDLAFTSNPLEPGAPGTPKATVNALRVIDVFTAH